MLLEDEGWDLDLLSNKNKASQRLKKIRPYSLRKLRRLRRLRRLRLMSINLYLYRTNNAKKKNNFAAAAITPTQIGVLRSFTSTNMEREEGQQKLVNQRCVAVDTINAHKSAITRFLAQTVWSKEQNRKQLCNHVMQVANLENQGRNNSNINKINLKLRQPLSLLHVLTHSNQRTEKGRTQPINLNKRLNNKYLIKRNDNKLKFIIN